MPSLSKLQLPRPNASRMVCRMSLMFRFTGAVADLDDTTPDEPHYPALALIIECGDDLARIVIPSTVWSPEKRDLLAVDRPIAISGESDADPFQPGARVVATSLRLLENYN